MIEKYKEESTLDRRVKNIRLVIPDMWFDGDQGSLRLYSGPERHYHFTNRLV
jgi:hypothetical protein